MNTVVIWPAVLILLVVGALCVFGLTLLFRKFGAGRVILALVVALPLLAIASLLMAFVSYERRVVSAPAVRTEPIDQLSYEQQRFAEEQAERSRLFAEAQAERARAMAEANAQRAERLAGRQERRARVVNKIQSLRAEGVDEPSEYHDDSSLQYLDQPAPPPESQDYEEQHAAATAHAVAPPAVPTAASHSRSNGHVQFQGSVRTSSEYGAVRKTFHVDFKALLVIFAMASFAVLIGVSVFLAAQGGSLSLRSISGKLTSILWVLPALAISAYPLWVVGGQLFTPVTPRQPVNEVMITAEQLPATHEEHAAGADQRSAATSAPAWINHPPYQNGTTRVVVVSSEYAPAVDDSETAQAIANAEADVQQQAAIAIRSYFGEVYPVASDWPIPSAVIRRAMGDVYLEEKTVEGAGKVYRRFAQIRLAPELRQQLYSRWREQQSDSRLVAMGIGFAMLTLLLGTSAGYLRLDRMTDGVYRGRLKVASLSLITAGAIAAGMCVT